MSEKLIEKQIIQYLNMHGAHVVAVGLNAGMIRSSYVNRGGNTRHRMIRMLPVGWPDVLCIASGQTILIEIKRDHKTMQKWERDKHTDRRSLAQHARHDELRAAGAIVIITCSLEDLIAQLGKNDIVL